MLETVKTSIFLSFVHIILCYLSFFNTTLWILISILLTTWYQKGIKKSKQNQKANMLWTPRHYQCLVYILIQINVRLFVPVIQRELFIKITSSLSRCARFCYKLIASRQNCVGGTGKSEIRLKSRSRIIRKFNGTFYIDRR